MTWLFAGENRALLSGHLLRRINIEDISSRFGDAPRIVFAEYLEHDGFRRRHYRVMQSFAISCTRLIKFSMINKVISNK